MCAYIEDLFDGAVNFRIVFIRALIKVARHDAGQIAEHASLPDGLHGHVGGALQV